MKIIIFADVGLMTNIAIGENTNSGVNLYVGIILIIKDKQNYKEL